MWDELYKYGTTLLASVKIQGGINLSKLYLSLSRVYGLPIPCAKCQDTVVFKDLFANLKVVAFVMEVLAAQGVHSKASHTLHESQKAKRPKEHVDRSC